MNSAPLFVLTTGRGHGDAGPLIYPRLLFLISALRGEAKIRHDDPLMESNIKNRQTYVHHRLHHFWRRRSFAPPSTDGRFATPPRGLLHQPASVSHLFTLTFSLIVSGQSPRRSCCRPAGITLPSFLLRAAPRAVVILAQRRLVRGVRRSPHPRLVRFSPNFRRIPASRIAALPAAIFQRQICAARTHL